MSREKALPVRYSRDTAVSILYWLFAFQPCARHMLHFTGSLVARYSREIFWLQLLESSYSLSLTYNPYKQIPQQIQDTKDWIKLQSNFARNKSQQTTSLEIITLHKRTWRCVELGKGLLNGLRVTTNRTEGGRQTVLETLHSKFHFILHITQFPYCWVLNSNARIFYCGRAIVAIQRGNNLPKTRLSDSWDFK